MSQSSCHSRYGNFSSCFGFRALVFENLGCQAGNETAISHLSRIRASVSVKLAILMGTSLLLHKISGSEPPRSTTNT